MKITSILFNKLFGDPETTTLENRIFNIVMLLSFVAALASLANDLVYRAPLAQLFISIVPTLLTLGFYFFSLKTKKYDYVALPVIIMFILILSVAWFTYRGIDGGTPYYFVIFVLAANMILKKSQKLYGLTAIAVVVAALMAVQLYFPEFYIEGKYNYRNLDVTTTFFLCLIIIVSMTNMILAEHSRDKERLQKALNEIKVLRKFIPICAECKKIRDEKGEWKRLEEYFQANTEMEFTHGLCPHCLEKELKYNKRR